MRFPWALAETVQMRSETLFQGVLQLPLMRAPRLLHKAFKVRSDTQVQTILGCAPRNNHAACRPNVHVHPLHGQASDVGFMFDLFEGEVPGKPEDEEE